MFEVRISDLAEADIREAFAWWRFHRSEEQADRWYANVHVAIGTLRNRPMRCARARESDLHPTGLRQLLFGLGRRPTHRIVFTVDEQVVTVVRVRHTSQADLDESELM